MLKQNLVTPQHPADQIDAVVKYLADENLIVTSELIGKGEAQTRSAVVDVAHEALIRHWKLLRGWLEVDRDHLRQKQRIETAAEEWDLRSRSNEYLWQGKLLTEARTFQQKQGETFPLSITAGEFIGKGLRQRLTNRLKFVGLGLIVPFGLAIYSGIQVAEYLRLRPHWDVIYSHTENNPVEKDALVRALREVNEAGRSLGEINLSNANLIAADLSNADLSNAILIAANLSSIRHWTDAQLSAAKLCRTKLPESSQLDPDRDCEEFKLLNEWRM